MRLTRVPPFATVHGIKERAPGSRMEGILETWCGKHPDPAALPTLDGAVAEINCTTCRGTKRFKEATS